MNEFSEIVSFSPCVKNVIHIGQSIARENMNAYFEPAHLLRALLHKDAGLHPLIKNLGQDIYYLQEWADVRIETVPKSAAALKTISAGEGIDEAMNEAESIRLQLSEKLVTPLHLLAALSTPGVGFSYEQLKSFTLKREELTGAIADKKDWQPVLRANGKRNGIANEKPFAGALLKYCIDKSLLVMEGKTDHIVGREKEVRMMAEILCRRSKPNVLLVGDPGVGKSAMVDAFALAIFQKKTPQLLYHAKIFELDTGSLVAGASYKGEIEDRLKSVLAEIRQFDKAILFIDEIHTLLDKQGSAAGAANLLKPELARGGITVIGATTIDEYRKYIQKDEAFNRRFEQLTVDEPDNATCFQMIKAVIPNYEKHHGIAVPDETISTIISLAKRYIKDRRLPDAALDLADRSMSALRMINDTGKKDLREFRTTIEEWIGSARTIADWQWLYSRMKNKISPVLWGFLQLEEDISSMTDTKLLASSLLQIIEELEPFATKPHTELDKNDVAAIVSHKTGIPVGKVQMQERERLLGMEAALKQRVVGQDHAIKSITASILESRAGLNKPGQPMGSFFFLGPTGTGKTELAKALAEFLFQDESSMIRFDMSEFKEEHAAALLYGAPPGYVGYEEGGLLVNKIRQKPYSVVLFDEIEKAHASVFDVFLQIMDEGKLHDKLGKEGDFSNALIIFTSNIGSEFVQEHFSKAGIPPPDKLMEIMSRYFRPEFLGRLTEIIPFASVSPQMVSNILQIQLKGLFNILHKKNIDLTISDAACEQLAAMGFTPKYGARPLSGVIRTQLRRPLSRMIISGELAQASTIHLDLDANNTFSWKHGTDVHALTAQ